MNDQEFLDECAMRAIQGMLASETVPSEALGEYISYTCDALVSRAYAIAREALERRDKEYQKWVDNDLGPDGE